MRRALGLDSSSSSKAQAHHPMSSSGNTHRRQFVRDGDVPVTVIHHDDSSGTNKLEAARQALREQVAAREHVERQLAETQAVIQTLETQLGHERIAKDEALRRTEDRRQQVERQLEGERAARQQAEHERDTAIAGRQEAEERLLEVMVLHVAQEPTGGLGRAKPSRKSANSAVADNAADREPEVRDAVSAQDAGAVKKRRGRPPQLHDKQPEFVEWWKPGWRDQFR